MQKWAFLIFFVLSSVSFAGPHEGEGEGGEANEAKAKEACKLSRAEIASCLKDKNAKVVISSTTAVFSKTEKCKENLQQEKCPGGTLVDFATFETRALYCAAICFPKN